MNQNEPTEALNALASMRKRLLDLTARNHLINFRHTKGRSLRIVDELPDQLCDALLENTELRFAAVPMPTDEELIKAGFGSIDDKGEQAKSSRPTRPPAKEWAQHLGIAVSFEVPEKTFDVADRHQDDAMQTLLYPPDLETRLKGLRSTAELAIQEMGANILYLAFGFLEWHEELDQGDSRLAPLFLIPVRLDKGKLNRKTDIYEYTLQYTGEDIITNLSLKEKLRTDFALDLPDLDENTLPEEYFEDIQKMLAKTNKSRWRVHRYISLVLLNFSKMLMYLDLDPERWPDHAKIDEHPLVTRFLSLDVSDDEAEEVPPGSFGYGEEYDIDSKQNVHADYPLVYDADSSQHSALIDALDGENLVIEGPPGTGKSQTITNLIAAALARGQKVLFVAEKMAALEVVRRRLDDAGLGEFCLELHSHKSQKRRVLDDVGTRLRNKGQYLQPADIADAIAHYEQLKADLQQHVEEISCPWGSTGKTRQEILVSATRYRELVRAKPKDLHPQGYDRDNYDATAQRRHEDQVQAHRKAYETIASQAADGTALQNHPWHGVSKRDLESFDFAEVKGDLEAWQERLATLQGHRSDIAAFLGCRPGEVAETLTDLKELAGQLRAMPVLRGDELLKFLPVLRRDTLKEAKRNLKLFGKIQRQYKALGKALGSDVVKDLSAVDRWRKGCRRLQELTDPEIRLDELHNANERLVPLEKQLVSLTEIFREIVPRLGDSASNLLAVSVAGLAELQSVINWVARLGPFRWKYRDELFDNDELDELLPQLRIEVDELRRLTEDLKGRFSLHRLPAENDIRKLQVAVAQSGLLRWLDKDWRAARQKLLGLRARKGVRVKDMVERLDTLADLASKNARLMGNVRYSTGLKGRIRGSGTDIESFEELRAWYKGIRSAYGSGFSNKAAMGSAILGLPEDDAKAIRSLADQGIPRQIKCLLDSLKEAQSVFSGYPPIHDESALLLGDHGTIPQLLQSVESATAACEPLLNDNSLSISGLIARVKELRSLKRRVQKWHEADLNGTVFGGEVELKTGVNMNNSEHLSVLKNTLKVATAIGKHVGNPALDSYLQEHPKRKTFKALARYSRKINNAFAEQKHAYDKFASRTGLDRDGWLARCGDHIDSLKTRNQSALESEQSFAGWLSYVKSCGRLEDLGLSALVAAVERLKVPIDQIEDAYRAGIYDLLATEILRECSHLQLFSGHAQNTLQENFRKCDSKLMKLQWQQIAWKIDDGFKVPQGRRGATVGEHTELSLLNHEIRKKTRHIPIRALLRRAGKAVVALKPCFMMGPMSVAQYLQPGGISFDLVVMDEASQIKPEDALGAVARGARIIVVGDPKQLPPTNFFERSFENEQTEESTDIEVSESILDVASQMFPARRLRWHYRSQHESLIAFSNHSFYDSDLVLFPSPHHEDVENYGVTLRRVEGGCFINSTNKEEAQAITAAIHEHFRVRPAETLGVVAMNSQQKEFIERLIEVQAKEDMAFGEWLDKDERRSESLFVKNLENVQGDERDVIFISMTYGPKEPGGKVFQRFGPINSDVGWRRLNVLFTRARKRMCVFSSMGSDDIIADETAKRGVRALHGFLRYCETGSFHKPQHHTGRPPDSDFEVAVAEALGRAGFECRPQVGDAGFFIDVAVLDPGNSGRYLMGIECDGATYHSAKSTRDRDRLRQEILERLGWKIRRIWSTDWFRDPQGQLAPIIRELNELKTATATAEESEEGNNVTQFAQGRKERRHR